MLKNIVVVAFVSLALCPTALADKGATLSPAAEAKWTDVPGFQGVKMAVVEGDPAKGPIL